MRITKDKAYIYCPYCKENYVTTNSFSAALSVPKMLAHIKKNHPNTLKKNSAIEL